jgi:3-hydroxybutyryl-CoA dehydrogenase
MSLTLCQTAVIGAGQMGSGIAQVFAAAGHIVKVYDLSDEIFEKSRARIFNSLKKLECK